MQPGKSFPPVPQRTAVVTGAAQGIGYGISAHLLEQGFAVGLLDLDFDAAQRAASTLAGSGRCRPYHADVSDEAQVMAAVDAVSQQLGPPTILVNNAAIFSTLRRRPFEQIPVDEWDAVMAVNVRGPFLMAKAVLAHMKSAGFGRVISISSNTVELGRPNFLHYVSSKAAVVGMTRAMARELGPHGITVNALMPSLTRTDVPTQVVTETTFAEIAAMQCIHRTGLPADIAHAVGFLASESASFITGQTIAVDGGAVFM